MKNYCGVLTGDVGLGFRLTKQRGSQKKEGKCGYECISFRVLNWLVK